MPHSHSNQVDKMTIDLETLMDKLEYYKLEYLNMDADAYYFPGEMPIQVCPFSFFLF